MQFSNTSTSAGILEDIDFICETNSTSYPTADKVRNSNRWYYKAITWILKANRTWEFDDTNLTDLPIATTTMVASQKDYALPTDLLKLIRVEVKDASGNFQTLDPINQDDIKVGLTEFQETDGMPKYYDIIGNSVFLYPSPSSSQTTLTSGLKLYYSREVDAFTSSDTTQEPTIAEPFHRILSYGASFDWFVARGNTQKAGLMRQELAVFQKELRDFYGDRNENLKTKVKPAHNIREYI